MRALLDVSTLIAFLDVNHQRHRRVRDWLDEHRAAGWASCAITQNGFVRIVSQPVYANTISTTQAIARLADATADRHHVFWSPSVQVVEQGLIDRHAVLGPGRVTDAYLLALATRHGGRLVTLDRNIPTRAVPTASADNLVEL